MPMMEGKIPIFDSQRESVGVVRSGILGGWLGLLGYIQSTVQ